MEYNVIECCFFSFLAVFILLGLLAILIRIIMAVFPDGEQVDNAPMVAAIHTAVAATFPGARVTRIEEIKK